MVQVRILILLQLLLAQDCVGDDIVYLNYIVSGVEWTISLEESFGWLSRVMSSSSKVKPVFEGDRVVVNPLYGQVVASVSGSEVK